MTVATARNQNGGHLEEVKKTPAEVEERPFCASLDAIARGRKSLHVLDVSCMEPHLLNKAIGQA